ncbi:MAG: hypothetical protein ACM3N4_13100, partial [Nitrososphaerota archaeon]
MQCPQCGSLNAPGQEVCIRCGYPLLPVRNGYGGAHNPPDYGAQNGPGYPYPAGGNESRDDVRREEWPALGGAPSQPLPPWLASTDSAPSSRAPSAPFPNGTPAPRDGQSNSWANQGNSNSGGSGNPGSQG